MLKLKFQYFGHLMLKLKFQYFGHLMLKLKFQYFGHLMQRANPLEQTRCWERLRVGGEGGDRG